MQKRTVKILIVLVLLCTASAAGSVLYKADVERTSARWLQNLERFGWIGRTPPEVEAYLRQEGLRPQFPENSDPDGYFCIEANAGSIIVFEPDYGFLRGERTLHFVFRNDKAMSCGVSTPIHPL